MVDPRPMKRKKKIRRMKIKYLIPTEQIKAYVGTVHGRGFCEMPYTLSNLFSGEHNFAKPREVRKIALKETNEQKNNRQHFPIVDQH